MYQIQLNSKPESIIKIKSGQETSYFYKSDYLEVKHHIIEPKKNMKIEVKQGYLLKWSSLGFLNQGEYSFYNDYNDAIKAGNDLLSELIVCHNYNNVTCNNIDIVVYNHIYDLSDLTDEKLQLIYDQLADAIPLGDVFNYDFKNKLKITYKLFNKLFPELNVKYYFSDEYVKQSYINLLSDSQLQILSDILENNDKYVFYDSYSEYKTAIAVFIGMIYEEHDQIDINCLFDMINRQGLYCYDFTIDDLKASMNYIMRNMSNSFDSMVEYDDKTNDLLIVHSLGNTQWYITIDDETDIIESYQLEVSDSDSEKSLINYEVN